MTVIVKVRSPAVIEQLVLLIVGHTHLRFIAYFLKTGGQLDQYRVWLLTKEEALATIMAPTENT